MLSALLAIALLLPTTTCAPMFSAIPDRFTAGRTINIPNFPMPFEVIDGIMSKLKFKSLFIDDPEAKQSPIALNTFAPAIQLSKTNFLRLQNYDKVLDGQLVNNGVYAEFIPNKKTPKENLPSISGGMLPKSSYRYVQHHIHWGPVGQKGSEHYFNGQQYDGELHIVHEATDGSDEDAVIAVFLQAGTDGSALKVEAETAPLITEYEHPTHIQIDGLTEKLPKSSTTNFMRYKGSLTTPRFDKVLNKLFCPEIVEWVVLTEPVQITQEQLSLLRKIRDPQGKEIVKNGRELQRTNKRIPILYSQAAPIV